MERLNFRSVKDTLIERQPEDKRREFMAHGRWIGPVVKGKKPRIPNGYDDGHGPHPLNPEIIVLV